MNDYIIYAVLKFWLNAFFSISLFFRKLMDFYNKSKTRPCACPRYDGGKTIRDTEKNGGEIKRLRRSGTHIRPWIRSL
jgi:hypothetical protein